MYLRKKRNNNNNNNNNNNSRIYNAYVMFYYKIPWFYQQVKICVF